MPRWVDRSLSREEIVALYESRLHREEQAYVNGDNEALGRAIQINVSIVAMKASIARESHRSPTEDLL